MEVEPYPEENKEWPSAEVDAETAAATAAQETLFFSITLSGAENDELQCTFPLELDATGFRINWVN